MQEIGRREEGKIQRMHARKTSQATDTRPDRKTTYSKLDGLDLALELAGLVGGDRARDDGAADTTGATEGGLAGHEDVGHVLVLAQQGKVEHNLDGLDVGSHDDELADTTVERLGGLVGTLLELLVVRSLLDQVEDLVGERGISQRESLGVGGRHGFESRKVHGMRSKGRVEMWFSKEETSRQV